ncbi:D-alanyl-D-alanine carboxypeptidase/D-alanyl-D-alanine-endopeptidase, partial [Psychromonas sp.]|nr:D-alanyl-D-alanine carboxypeptidase/D-alanyl-D-alanine-endopeptidase [Psychromonas sp.]
MLKIYCLLVTHFFCTAAIAQQWQDLHSFLPKGAQVSYLVIDAKEQSTIASFHEQTLRTPASVQKLLTATTAKLYLGADYRYQTSIQGNSNLITDGEYEGNLTLYFSGDPSLTRNNIRKMLLELKLLGVRKVTGNFILNKSHFNGYQWSDGQAWNDLGVCYTAPSSAIIINKNCVLGNLSLKHEGAKKATLYIPDYEPINITSDVSVVTIKQREERFCALEVTRNSQNKYHLWGCIVPRQRYFPLAFAVNDPGLYAQNIIADELESAGIQLTGQVKVDSLIVPVNGSGQLKDGSETLVLHQSEPLDVLLQEMMKESDNLIADSLFKTVGARYFQQPGNFRNGAIAMKAILKANGIDLENAYIADGSGLSRHNLMSAELFMSVLQFAYRQNSTLDLLRSFSIAGVDGTLQYHKGVNTQKLKGKVIAKTGSLKGVVNMLGLVKSDDGDKLFVLMINGYNNEDNPMNETTQKQPDESVYLFEKA